MTRADHVDAIRRRLLQTTPGRWCRTAASTPEVRSGARLVATMAPGLGAGPDAEFIACAPADIDWLLTELTAAAAREEMLLADLESTRANLEVAWDVAGNAEYDLAEAVRDRVEAESKLAESEEARLAAVAAHEARRERAS